LVQGFFFTFSSKKPSEDDDFEGDFVGRERGRIKADSLDLLK